MCTLVLEDIRRNASVAAVATKKYTDMLMQVKAAKQKKETEKHKRELKAADKRIAELGKIIARLYEDSALGKISEERYRTMSSAYEQEQRELKEKRGQLAEGIEFWYARELQPVLEYTQWRNFESVVEKAKNACLNSGNSVPDHFADVSKTIEMPKTATKEVNDYMLSRYACYLIVQNGDPRKEVIALGQTYFAVKTRQQELIEDYDRLNEEQKRLAIRNEMIAHNKSLAEAAQMAGIENSKDYAIFQNKGYQGLYGGLGVIGSLLEALYNCWFVHVPIEIPR